MAEHRGEVGRLSAGFVTSRVTVDRVARGRFNVEGDTRSCALAHLGAYTWEKNAEPIF